MRTYIVLLCAAVLGCGAGIAAADNNTDANADGQLGDNSTQRIVSPPRTPTNTDAAGTARNGRDASAEQNRLRPTGNPDTATSRDGTTH